MGHLLLLQAVYLSNLLDGNLILTSHPHLLKPNDSWELRNLKHLRKSERLLQESHSSYRIHPNAENLPLSNTGDLQHNSNC